MTIDVWTDCHSTSCPATTCCSWYDGFAWSHYVVSVKQTCPVCSPDASPYELLITINYKCHVHMCTPMCACNTTADFFFSLLFHYETWDLNFHPCIKIHPICYCLLWHVNCLLQQLGRMFSLFQTFTISFPPQAVLLIILLNYWSELNEDFILIMN